MKKCNLIGSLLHVLFSTVIWWFDRSFLFKPPCTYMPTSYNCAVAASAGGTVSMAWVRNDVAAVHSAGARLRAALGEFFLWNFTGGQNYQYGWVNFNGRQINVLPGTFASGYTTAECVMWYWWRNCRASLCSKNSSAAFSRPRNPTMWLTARKNYCRRLRRRACVEALTRHDFYAGRRWQV